MQATPQLLCQYCLPHLQVYFLQHPAKVGELFRPGVGGARLGEEVPLDGIDTGVTSVVFHAHLFKCTSKGHQPFLPLDYVTLFAIQLPLLSKELPL
jgi:hypothetical protein